MTRRKRCPECGHLGCTNEISTKRYIPITITLIEEHRRSLKWRAECNTCGFYAESMDRAHGDEIASLPVLVHADTHAA